MARALRLITAPSVTPVSVTEAKLHLRLEAAETAEDTLITMLIEAAVDKVQSETGLQLVTATYELELDGFEDEIELPRAPLQSITSITYTDTAGVSQTVSTGIYGVQTPLRTNGTVYRKDGQAWPSDVSANPGSVRVRFVCGYGLAAAVPASIKAAMLLIIGHLYESREDVVVGTTATPLPMGAAALLSAFSLGTVPR